MCSPTLRRERCPAPFWPVADPAESMLASGARDKNGWREKKDTVSFYLCSAPVTQTIKCSDRIVLFVYLPPFEDLEESSMLLSFAPHSETQCGPSASSERD